MSKELEALDYMKTLFGCWKNLAEKDNLETKEIELEKYVFKENYDTIKQALNELQAIKNSNPSEALKCLEEIDNIFYLNKRRTTENGNHEEYEFYPCETKEYNIIEQALIKAQEREKLLSILREKRIDIERFYTTFIEDNFDYNYYEKSYGTYGLKCLTEEEFNITKEILKK